MSDDFIQSGDVFVKRYGKREIVHIFVERTNPPFGGSGKWHYLRSSGHLGSTHIVFRSVLKMQKYRFVGSVPDDFLQALMRNRFRH